MFTSPIVPCGIVSVYLMAPDEGASTVMTQCPFINNHSSVQTFTALIVSVVFTFRVL